MADSRNQIVRPSHLLIVHLDGDRYVAENPMIGKKRVIPHRLLGIFQWLAPGERTAALRERLEAVFPGTAVAGDAIDEMLRTGILVARGTPLDEAETAFSGWAWGRETALHFLAMRRVRWLEQKAEPRAYANLLNEHVPPRLWDDISEPSDRWLPLGIDLKARNVFNALRRRRTVRQFSTQELSRHELGSILSAGLGIFDFLELPLRPTHPLKFSPSPGGLNAIGAYVFLQISSEFDAGIYLYNGLRNQLHRIAPQPFEHCLSEMLGHQPWMDEAPVICVLYADCKKMNWKYTDESAFNSLQIECGHIAQNMMICASSLGLGSVPTNAIDQPLLERYLPLTFPDQIALYAIGFGHRDIRRPNDCYSNEALREFCLVRDQAGHIDSGAE